MKQRLSLACLAAIAVSAVSYAGPGIKVESDLLDLIGKPGTSNVRVIIFLKRQHAAEAAANLAPLYSPRLEGLAEQMRTLATATRSMPSMDRNGERGFPAKHVFNSAVLKPIATQIDAVRTEYGDAIARFARSTAAMDLASIRNLVETLGGKVVDETIVNSTVIADVPSSQVLRIAESPGVATISREHPMEKELDVSAKAMLAEAFWTNGSTGGPADVGVLDTGSQRSHAAFAGFRWEALSLNDNDGHGTHVTGIMCSADATYRGMAWGADTVSVYATTGESQSMVGLNWLMNSVTERAEDVNHSFGYGTANSTDYRNTDQFFDGACDTFSVLVSKSAGNNGYGTTTITHPAPAYNLIAVASMDDKNTVARTDDRISNFSSSGPTLGGRKKPDITAPGSNIMSTLRSGGFGSMSGTSMAAPHAGGSVILLMGLGAPSPMAAKAILINTADAMNSKNTASTADDVFVNGSFWDKAYGWGYINLSNAYLHAPDVFERTLPSPNGGTRQFRLFKGQLFANEKATVTWNRHVAFNGSSYPTIIRQLSNLDLKCFDASSGSQTASSASTIDNVEQIASPGDAMSVLKVSAEGNFDPNLATEKFALATQENFVEAIGPKATGAWSKTPGSNPAAPFFLTVTVTNTGDLPIFNATAFLENYVVVSGPNPTNIGTIAPGQSVQVKWTVKRGPVVGIVHAKVTVTSNSFGEDWAWQLIDPNSV